MGNFSGENMINGVITEVEGESLKYYISISCFRA